MSNPNARNFWASLVINAVDIGPEMRRELRPAMATLRGKESTLEEVCELVADVLDMDARRVREKSLLFLSQYVKNQFNDAVKAARWLVVRDRRIGVWAALACASWALDVASELRGNAEFQRVIEVGRNCVRVTVAWTQGLASVDAVREATASPGYVAYASDAGNAASYAAFAAIEPETKEYIGYAVAAVPDALQEASSSVKSRKKVLRDLVSVIADAILDFPPAVRSNPTRRRRR